MFESEYAAFRFFDILQSRKVTKDQFLFGINFLQVPYPGGLKDVIQLFTILDTKNDGFIDEVEFQ